METQKKIKNNIIKCITEYSLVGNIIINIILVFLAIRLGSVTNINYKIILIEISMIVVLMVFLNVYYYKSLSKVRLEKEKIEINYRYNEVVSELVENIKGNQHEYKNHINTITSILYLSSDIEEAKKEVKKYIKSTSQEFDFNKVLSIDNIVMRAIIYSKALECEDKGIEFTFSIKGDVSKINIDSSDLTVILSNILNNAIEASEKSVEKKINLEIEINERKYIRIKNTIENIEVSELSNFLERGFSKSGKDRGYGLYNVKKVIKKYSGDIKIKLEDNWIAINIKM